MSDDVALRGSDGSSVRILIEIGSNGVQESPFFRTIARMRAFLSAAARRGVVFQNDFPRIPD